MRTNAHKENIIFQRSKNYNVVKLSQIYPNNVLEDIDEVLNNKEDVYIFESGDKANFLYHRDTIDRLSFNYYQIYNKSIYLCFKEIVSMLSEAVNECQIDKKRNMYYLTSEYETEFIEDFWYDTGGIGVPIFAGYWFLNVSDSSYIKINDEKYLISEGSLILFQSGAKTSFHNVNKAISFNISTISKIYSQYPQKWMPIVL